ncbi:uncharacterized protein LOC131156379 [Malania oleifera]|uniref:uncharacterized protein LOC131156379 n=1 Tax=Malania oleifera TaxID=397392 RepID=UPI0025AE269E|nr:uncharacterized protein LOC131156379 [Malania oleifera]
MDLSSWLRRSFSRNTREVPNPDASRQPNKEQEHEAEEAFGITQQLTDFVKSFTLDTFKNFPLPDDEGGGWADDSSTSSSANSRKDLSVWQERHATLVLSRVKEISLLRYKLCPRHLKERQFWRIYFSLVKSYVAEYELHSIRLAKIRQMTMEKEKSSDRGAFEVEMAETKHATSVVNETSSEYGLNHLSSGTRGDAG